MILKRMKISSRALTVKGYYIIKMIRCIPKKNEEG
jgi:hypothetical protein